MPPQPPDTLPFHEFCHKAFYGRDMPSVPDWTARIRCQEDDIRKWCSSTDVPDVATLITIDRIVMATPTLFSGEQRDRWQRIITMPIDDAARVPPERANEYFDTMHCAMQAHLARDLSAHVSRCPPAMRLELMRRLLHFCQVDEHYRAKG